MKRIISLLVCVSLITASSVFMNAEEKIDDKQISTFISEYFVILSEQYTKNNSKKIDQSLESLFAANRKNLSYIHDKGIAEYILLGFQLESIDILTFKSIIEDISIIEEDDTTLTVFVTEKREMLTSIDSFTDVCYKAHRFNLITTDNKILISEHICDDELNSLFPLGSNLSDELSNLKRNHKKNILDNIESQGVIPMQNEFEDENSLKSLPGTIKYDYFGSSNRSNAVSYAKQYTESGLVDGNGYDGDNYNDTQFDYYTSNNDCQNLVCQSIWYGFGGRDSSTHSYPMNGYWWADANGHVTGPDYEDNTWTAAGAFKTMITNNYSSNDYGIQAYSTTPSNVQVGDYVYVPGHVLLITEINDDNGIIEYGDLSVTAHTWDHEDRELWKIYTATQPSNMEFIHIYRNKYYIDAN